MRTFEGRLDAENKSFAIVASRFNEMIVGHLVNGAESALKRHGVADDDITHLVEEEAICGAECVHGVMGPGKAVR